MKIRNTEDCLILVSEVIIVELSLRSKTSNTWYFLSKYSIYKVQILRHLGLNDHLILLRIRPKFDNFKARISQEAFPCTLGSL